MDRLLQLQIPRDRRHCGNPDKNTAAAIYNCYRPLLSREIQAIGSQCIAQKDELTAMITRRALWWEDRLGEGVPQPLLMFVNDLAQREMNETASKVTAAFSVCITTVSDRQGQKLTEAGAASAAGVAADDAEREAALAQLETSRAKLGLPLN